MNSILGLDRAGLLALDPTSVTWALTADEVFHMAAVFEGWWAYDYAKLEQGKPGKHARLKSLWHSEGFFYSAAILVHANLRRIMAEQIVRRLKAVGAPLPTHVIGVPNSASSLGKEVAEILGVPHAVMKKGANGRMYLETQIPPGASVLFVEDVCTKGTGFKEAVETVVCESPGVYFVLYDPVILSRGGLKEIIINGVGTFAVLPIVERQVQGWPPEACPLCQRGSEPIRPKADSENWRALVHSQD